MAAKKTFLSQHTIGTEVSATGIGLHSGKKVRLVLHPAPANTGIIFNRGDIPNSSPIPANPNNVSDTKMASTIGEKDTKISTVEHFMSACAGLAIDNLYVSVFGEEMPIMDGSASSFVFLLQSAGLVKQNLPRRFIRVKETVRVEDPTTSETKWAELRPYNDFKLSFDIKFNHPVIDKTQHMNLMFSKDRFLNDIARARTFGFSYEVEYLRDRGLAIGGGLHNAIVIDEMKVLNQGGLRIDGEFVRHKMLDAIGDLYLAGAPLLAEYVANRSGHALNNQLLRALFEKNDSFEMVSLPTGIGELKTGYHSFE